jgi:hypothetical protein
MNENGKLLSVGSQIKNGGLIILLGVDGLWVSRGFLTGLNVRIAFLRVEATAGTSAHIIFGESGKVVCVFCLLHPTCLDSCMRTLRVSSIFP